MRQHFLEEAAQQFADATSKPPFLYELGPDGECGGTRPFLTVITKTDALRIIGRAYGPLRAESLTDRLPERIDFDNEADIELLFALGLTRDGLFGALGGEL